MHTIPSDLNVIRTLNDNLRKGLDQSGQVVLGPGIRRLGGSQLADIRRAIACFDRFADTSDHSSGTLQLGDLVIEFRIDCFEPTMSAVAHDPADIRAERVLYISLASDN